MEETNRRKSWQHRTSILLPKSKAENICENLALFDTFNNMFLYGAVKKVFYLNPTARSYLLKTAATYSTLHRTWYESNSRCQSDCYTYSASAFSSCLHPPDTLHNTKFLLARLNEPQESSLWCFPSPSPFSLNITHGPCHTSPFSDNITAAPYTSSEVILVRPPTQKTYRVSHDTVKIRAGLNHRTGNTISILFLWQGAEEGEGEERSALTKLPRWRQPWWKLQTSFLVLPQALVCSFIIPIPLPLLSSFHYWQLCKSPYTWAGAHALWARESLKTTISNISLYTKYAPVQSQPG